MPFTTCSPAPVVQIRAFRAGDIAALIALNNAAVPAVNALTAEELTDQIAKSRMCLVAVETSALESQDVPLGFLLCYQEGMSYDSRNYKWICNKLDRFFYTDRICVDVAQRGRRIGEALYRALFDALGHDGRPFTCEVNTRPANEGSIRFHKRMGFDEIGTSDYGDKAVVYLQRPSGEA